VGIALSHWLQMPEVDGAASVPIGILLAGVAGRIAWQSRCLLIGEGIRPETARALRDIALAQPGMRNVGRVLSMYVGPDDALVTMDLDFDVETKTSDASLTMVEVERRVRERFPMIRRLFIESGSAAAPQRWSGPDAI
jgi:divalent metal cation (Fe/Co/Zn/Cd) transporter